MIEYIYDACIEVAENNKHFNDAHKDPAKIIIAIADAYNNNEIIVDKERRGFIWYVLSNTWFGDDTESFDRLVYVSPEHRGEGVATTLINKYIGTMLELGVSNIYLGNSLHISDASFKALMNKFKFKEFSTVFKL